MKQFWIHDSRQSLCFDYVEIYVTLMSSWVITIFLAFHVAVQWTFLLKCFGGHKSFLCSHWYPCFGPLVMPALGFKARVDLLACFLVCTLFLRFTSGVTPGDCIEVSMAASHIPYMHVAEVGCRDSNGRPPLGHRDRAVNLNTFVQWLVIRCREHLDSFRLYVVFWN